MIIFVFAITKVQRYKTRAFNVMCIRHSYIYKENYRVLKK